MTYLDLINQFWQKDLEFSFTADEVNLYFRLLKHANLLRWQKPRFNMAVDKLMLEVGIKTKRPFDTARRALRDAGLIDFVNGNGRGCTTEYCIIGAETLSERGAKNNPLSATLSATIPQGFRDENVPLHKSKIKKEDKEVANATRAHIAAESSTPSLKAKKQLVPPVAKPPRAQAAETDPNFDDFWQAYGKKLDLYKCQQRWRALTPAEQAAALAHVPRYVAATPEKRYRKNPLTYLNGRAWLDEDTPEPAATSPSHGPAPAPARAATSPTKAKAQSWH
ncbi:MAG: hypothetical protein ACRYG7_25255 [Janthinobacterium lividum]